MWVQRSSLSPHRDASQNSGIWWLTKQNWQSVFSSKLVKLSSTVGGGLIGCGGNSWDSETACASFQCSFVGDIMWCGVQSGIGIGQKIREGGKKTGAVQHVWTIWTKYLIAGISSGDPSGDHKFNLLQYHHRHLWSGVKAEQFVGKWLPGLMTVYIRKCNNKLGKQRGLVKTKKRETTDISKH